MATLVPLLGGAMLVGEELHFEQFTPEHGLAHNTANAMLQDGRGFIWIATDDGLDRYDGYEFRHYRLDPARESSNVFMEILEGSTGELWVGSRSGLLRFSPEQERFEAVDLKPESTEQVVEVTALAEDRDGRLLVARGDQLFVGEGEDRGFRVLAEIDQRDHRVSESILEIELDAAGDLWMLFGDRSYRSTAVARFDRTTGTVERFSLSGEHAFGRAFYIDSRGNLWLSASRGSSPLPGAPRLPEAIPSSVGVQVVAETDDGVVWMGTTGDGLYRLNPDDPASLRHHRFGATWQDNYVLDLLIDRAGSVWVSTLAGVRRHDPDARPFRHINVPTGRKDDLGDAAVSAIRQSNAGEIWIGTFGSGLAWLSDSSSAIRVYRHDPSDPSSLCDDTIWGLHVDDADRVWVGGASSLCTFDPESGRFARVSPPQAWDRSLDTRVLGQIDSSILVGFLRHGLYAYNPETGEWRSLIATDSLLTSVEVVDDTVWAGFHTGVLARIDGRGEHQRIELHSSAGARLSHLTIYDIQAAADGRLWLATAGGLARFATRSHQLEYPVAADVLPGTVCFSVQEDLSGDLWAGTNQGLARITVEPATAARALVFDHHDGLGNIEFNRSAALLSTSGEMLLGGMTGLTVFRPQDVRANPVSPPIAITRLSVVGREGERSVIPAGLERLTLSPDDHAVSFEFSALSFIAPEKNEYAYRIQGLDPDWVHAGTRRFARYASLPPGDYQFQVKGSNNHGVWSEAALSVPLTVLPPFWKTIPFRLAVAAAVGMLILLAHRARVRRMLELEKMRLRIAADLHDELGGELSSIALSSSIALREEYLAEPERKRLQDIEARTRRVALGLRDIVWYINPEHDSISDMVRRMRSFAGQILEETNWTFDTAEIDEDDSIPMTVRRDLYLIFKELLTNVARHAEANGVTIRLRRRQQRLRLVVEDDGLGFDPSARSEGDGLANTRRRAERAGAELKVESRSGGGTRITLDYPLTRIRGGGRSPGSLHSRNGGRIP